MASNNGGPWGTGGGGNRPTGPGGDNRGGDNRNGGRRPGDQPQIPEIEDMLNKGNEYLKVLMGGKGAAVAAPAVLMATAPAYPRALSLLWFWALLAFGRFPLSTP